MFSTCLPVLTADPGVRTTLDVHVRLIRLCRDKQSYLFSSRPIIVGEWKGAVEIFLDLLMPCVCACVCVGWGGAEFDQSCVK